MEIHALKVVISDQEVNKLIAREMARAQKGDLRDLLVRFTPEGIFLSGVYDTRMMDLPFETLWVLSVNLGKLALRLASFRPLSHVGGKAFSVVDFFSKGSLKSLLMGLIADALKTERAFEVEGETITFDLDQLLAQRGVSIRTHLTGLFCQPGQLVIEAGLPPS